MPDAEDAIRELVMARDGDVPADVRTQLDPIAASLRETLEAEAGEPSSPEGALAETGIEFEGAAPHVDDLVEIEEKLDALP